MVTYLNCVLVQQSFHCVYCGEVFVCLHTELILIHLAHKNSVEVRLEHVNQPRVRIEL